MDVVRGAELAVTFSCVRLMLAWNQIVECQAERFGAVAKRGSCRNTFLRASPHLGFWQLPGPPV